MEKKVVEGGEVEKIFVVEENGRKEKDNLGKLCGCGERKEIRKKEKGKEIRKEKIFSWKR